MNKVHTESSPRPSARRQAFRRRPWIFFLLLTTAVAFPWFLQSGFLFLLDFVWSPTLPSPLENLSNAGDVVTIPYRFISWIASLLIPTPVVQKLALSLPFFLAGLSMFHLAQWLLRTHMKHGGAQIMKIQTFAAYAAGTFYALNPFVAVRVFMGQHFLLLAYALTPWVLLAALQFIHRPLPRRAFTVGLITAGTMLINTHHLVFIPILLLPFILLFLLFDPTRGTDNLPPRSRLWKAGMWFLIPVIPVFLIFSTGTRPSLDPLDPWARALQAPHTGSLFIDTLTLTATWKTNLPFFLPFEILPEFLTIATMLLVTMVFGILFLLRDTHAHAPVLARSLLIITFVSVFLAIGVAHPITEPLSAWLYRYVPFWIGMRDSAKFLALLALTESIFLAFGVVAITRWLAANVLSRFTVLLRVIPLAFLVITLFFISPTLLGFSRQIYPLHYPESWAEWNARLDQDEEHTRPRMLFLPWKMYLSFEFTDDRTIVNPAQIFFTNAEVIASKTSTVGGRDDRPLVISTPPDQMLEKITALLFQYDTLDTFGAALAEDNIRYVALATDTIDTDRYAFLFRQHDLRLVFESDDLLVWENTAQKNSSREP